MPWSNISAQAGQLRRGSWVLRVVEVLESQRVAPRFTHQVPLNGPGASSATCLRSCPHCDPTNARSRIPIGMHAG